MSKSIICKKLSRLGWMSQAVVDYNRRYHSSRYLLDTINENSYVSTFLFCKIPWSTGPPGLLRAPCCSGGSRGTKCGSSLVFIFLLSLWPPRDLLHTREFLVRENHLPQQSPGPGQGFTSPGLPQPNNHGPATHTARGCPFSPRGLKGLHTPLPLPLLFKPSTPTPMQDSSASA